MAYYNIFSMRSEARVLPGIFIERLRKIIPSQKLDSVANTFAGPKPVTFRANLLKSSPAEVRQILGDRGFRLEPAGWYRDAFILRDGRLRELQETEIYKNGLIYVQNLSSMVPVLVLDPRPGETVLDLTAAPGSKTTQIAAFMQGQGKIVANDNNKIRFFKLKANVELQSAVNVQVTLEYGEAFGRKRPGEFDRVLLDAPCSAEGRFDVREPASYRYWKPGKVKEMARKQKKLFYSAVSALKPGGVLVYSTCTFAPEENEAVVDWAIRKFPGALGLEKITLPFPNQMPGLSSWDGEAFDPAVRRSLRILPTGQMEGFFITKLRKLV